jgi:hypothetical protein
MLFITPRADKGLTLLSQEFCQSDRYYLLFHAIGSGQITIGEKPNLELAKYVQTDAVAIQQELAAKAFKGDLAAMRQQRESPPDLESMRISISIEYTTRYLLADLASKFGTTRPGNSQATSVSALLRAIGYGDLSLIGTVDPEIRLRYLRNTQVVKEYLACRRMAKEKSAHAARLG